MRHNASRKLEVGLESDTDRDGPLPRGGQEAGLVELGIPGGRGGTPDGSCVLSRWAGPEGLRLALDVLLVVNLGSP